MPSEFSQFSPEQAMILTWIVRVMNSIGLLSTFIVVLLVLLRGRRLEHALIRMAAYISVSEFISFTVVMMGEVPWNVSSRTQSILCIVEAAVMEASCFWSFMWTATLGFDMYRRVVAKSSGGPYFMILAHVWCWGSGIIVSVSLYLRHLFVASSSSMCWLANPHDVYRIAFFYGPLGLVFLFNLFVIVQAWSALSKLKKAAANDDTNLHLTSCEITLNSQVCAFLLANFFCWVPAIANTAQVGLQPNRPLFWLNILGFSTPPLLGVVALIFFFNLPLVREEVSVLCHKGLSWKTHEFHEYIPHDKHLFVLGQEDSEAPLLGAGGGEAQQLGS